MEGFDAVSFDLDRTLCRYRRPADELLNEAFETVGVEPFFTVGEYGATFDSFADDAPDIETLRRRCFRALAAEHGVDPTIGEEVAAVYSAHRDPAAVEPLPGAIDIVEQTGGQYQIALITNGFAPVQSRKVEALGLGSTFDQIVYAGTDTAFKPDAEPFHHVANELSVSPRQMIHIGDSIHHDVAGANQAGLSSVWISGVDIHNETPQTSGIQPDYMIESISDLVPYPWER